MPPHKFICYTPRDTSHNLGSSPTLRSQQFLRATSSQSSLVPAGSPRQCTQTGPQLTLPFGASYGSRRWGQQAPQQTREIRHPDLPSSLVSFRRAIRKKSSFVFEVRFRHRFSKSDSGTRLILDEIFTDLMRSGAVSSWHGSCTLSGRSPGTPWNPGSCPSR